MHKQNMNHLGKLIFAFLFLFVISNVSRAQTTTQHTLKGIEKLIQQADSAYGSHHELVNGKLYYRANLYALGTPFYLSDDWVDGTVWINGKQYNKVALKYNIETDQLIMRPTIKNGMTMAIVLNSPFVEAFTLKDHLFVNADGFKSEDLKSEFINVVYKGTFEFLATYRVTFVTDYNTKTPYGRYSAISNSYFIYAGEDLVKIPSKKVLLDYFEAYKKEIRKFMKKKKMRFNKANSGQWNGLMKSIDELITASVK